MNRPAFYASVRQRASGVFGTSLSQAQVEGCEAILDEAERRGTSIFHLAAILSEQGVQVARRTVAKYREAMAIPPSNERKRLA